MARTPVLIEIEQLIEEGNKARTVAATNMNSESSRSHAVFTVILTQTVTDVASGVSGEKLFEKCLFERDSGILSRSARAQSLTTLGLVISKLADQAVGKARSKGDNFVPYRDSVLTWLLKDNLGGNSRTVMVATVSPAGDNFEETLSTLRYADRAKRIVNHAVVNEDPNAKIIRELREEVETLRTQLLSLRQMTRDGPASLQEEESLNEKLHESEKLITNLSETWENKLKKTERVQQERQQALEKMGISVQASGISVEKNKYYLVNLNADPSLNEMLVYYLKERTLVGRPDAGSEPNDIQLSGVGIETHHSVLCIENGDLFIEPYPNARTCVNGSQVTEKVQLRHGDRILWGFNYFFRVNCPKTSVGGNNSEPQTPAQPIDYNFAREELMLKELSNDPIQAAIQNLERQHEEDKQMALEKQRQEYEKQFQQLRNILSPTTPYAPYMPFDPLRGTKMTPSTPTSQLRIERWAQEREDMLEHSSILYPGREDTFRRSLAQLRQDIMKANTLVREANIFADEMGKQTTFGVTLQIPPQNLSPNRKRWSELTRKIEMWVEIQELGECGDYVSVEVSPQKDVMTGGVYQLRQGQQRRIVCRVKPVSNSGTLPLICEAITNISIGSVCGRLRCQRQLDSYTEEDLNVLRERWSEALKRRRMYLDQQIQKIINKGDKNECDTEREQSLVDQWVSLTEERNAVLVPAAGSSIPGAPADWDPPSGMEAHVPVLFLDLNADDFSTQGYSGDSFTLAGNNAIIPKENCNKFFQLPIVKCYEKDVCAVASWDSSIHDNMYLNRLTPSDERVYLIVKAVASEELEERESLAQMAANADDSHAEDGETYIGEYCFYG
ncbi:Kinesin-like protein KIF13A [Portunus trituberculatus]|uniref:Kinesin-like protein KIF13A n=1 Tax=Portunus trituberculatus TaxID=210409 RepID=A0A5B7DGU4_PORTR|nr:Kinesin-like protein KIF13A [Portunus trituberculatus]